jgi:hypothetical protein
MQLRIFISKRSRMIRSWRIHLGGLLYVGCAFTGAALGSQNYTATVGQVQWALTDTCFFFSLVGVAVADPVVPNSPWFAIPLAQTGFSQAYALMLSAKTTGATVIVSTTGALAGGTCGTYAGVAAVNLQ